MTGDPEHTVVDGAAEAPTGGKTFTVIAMVAVSEHPLAVPVTVYVCDEEGINGMAFEIPFVQL